MPECELECHFKNYYRYHLGFQWFFFFKCAIEMVGFIDTLSEIKEMNDSQNEPETMSSNRFDITTDSEDIDKV